MTDRDACHRNRDAAVIVRAKPRRALEAEVVVLRHQVAVLQRTARRPELNDHDPPLTIGEPTARADGRAMWNWMTIRVAPRGTPFAGGSCLGPHSACPAVGCTAEFTRAIAPFDAIHATSAGST